MTPGNSVPGGKRRPDQSRSAQVPSRRREGAAGRRGVRGAGPGRNLRNRGAEGRGQAGVRGLAPGVSGSPGEKRRALPSREGDPRHRCQPPAAGAAPRPCPPGGPGPPPRSAGSREKGGVGRPGRSGKARILPQAGVHLALVGPDLPVAPVFLVHELVLVVLIHVHLPEPGGRHRVLRHPRSRAAAKASSSCGLYLGEPSRPGTRSLVPSLPSSALGRRRQPRLGRFWACALTTRLPPGVLAQIEPPTPPGSPPGSAREGGSGPQCAGADSLQRRGGAGRSEGGGGGGGAGGGY